MKKKGPKRGKEHGKFFGFFSFFKRPERSFMISQEGQI